MIVVRVELWSAITGQKTELARMTICNVGGTQSLGDYAVATMTGRNHDALTASMVKRRHTRSGSVTGRPRLTEHVWNLVAKGLTAMGYGARGERPAEPEHLL